MRSRALYRRDPVAYAKDVLGVDVEGGVWAEPGQRAYQAEILRSVADYSQTYVASGNAAGKDFTLSLVVPWWITTGEGICVTTATKQDQVSLILWGEIRSRVQRARVPLGGRLLPARPEWQFGPKHYAVGTTAKDENAFQGFHGKRVLVIGDEAAGIVEWVWPAIFGCAVGEDDRIVFIGNPTCAPTHPFAKGAMAAPIPGVRNSIRVKGTETPNYRRGETVIPGLQTREGVERIYRTFGKGSAIANARVEAQFPDAGADSMIGYQHIGPARERWAKGVRATDADLDFVRLGVDVARFGDDLTCVAARAGPEAWFPEAATVAGFDTVQVGQMTAAVARRYGAHGIAVDGGAMGPGAIDVVRHHAISTGCRPTTEVFEVAFGGKAYAEHEFADRRTELWFRMREWLETEGSIEIDDALEEELLAPTMSYVGTRLKMEPKPKTKERLGRSPDRADALALAISGHLGQPLSLYGSGALESEPTRWAESEWDEEDAPQSAEPLRGLRLGRGEIS